MIPFKLEGKSIEIAESWEQITLGSFLLLTKAGDSIFKMLEALSGISAETWKNTSELDIDLKLMPFLDYLKQPPDLSRYAISKQYSINNIVCDVPDDLTIKTLGQKIMAQKAIAKAIDESTQEQLKAGIAQEKINPITLSAMPEVLAIYFQPIYDKGKFDDDKAKELQQHILKTKLIEAYPIGAFFLRKLVQSSMENNNISVQNMTSSKRMQVIKK